MGNPTSVRHDCEPTHGTAYDTVTVLTIYWEDAGYEEVKANAEQVGRVFKNSYNYDVASFPLLGEYKDTTAKLLSKLTDMTGHLNKENA